MLLILEKVKVLYNYLLSISNEILFIIFFLLSCSDENKVSVPKKYIFSNKWNSSVIDSIRLDDQSGLYDFYDDRRIIFGVDDATGYINNINVVSNIPIDDFWFLTKFKKLKCLNIEFKNIANLETLLEEGLIDAEKIKIICNSEYCSDSLFVNSKSLKKFAFFGGNVKIISFNRNSDIDTIILLDHQHKKIRISGISGKCVVFNRSYSNLHDKLWFDSLSKW